MGDTEKISKKMTFLEALYGSQYDEISKRGKDGAAGRLNGNLFLSAFVIICLFLLIAIPAVFSADFTEGMNRLFHKLFGYSSGKTIGKLLAIPLMGLIYFVISKTVGSIANYERLTKIFDELPEAEKQKANKKVLIPFFVVLISLFALMIISLF